MPAVEKILIIDFGSQVTQLIARRLRELNVYCEIRPFNAVTGDDLRAERQVGDEHAVHDIPVDEVHPGLLEGHALVAQPGEVDG